jgi:hypothetical protein
MLGGRPPFTGQLTQLVAQKLMQSPQPLTSLRSDISPSIERAVMHALAREASERPVSAGDWFEEFEEAIGDQSESSGGDARVVIMASAGAEVYIDDERKGSVGRSGRVVLTSIAPGQHVLRVSRIGDADDERIIEIRPDGVEQIIQAQFRDEASSDHLSPSQGGSLASKTGSEPIAHRVVACTKCHSRFAQGVRFCGRCGNTSFQTVKPEALLAAETSTPLDTTQEGVSCGRCGREYPPETRYCGNCGIPMGASSLNWKAPRPVEVLCKLCGTSYPATTGFCGNCGKSLHP